MYFFLILQKYVSQKVVNAGQNIELCRQLQTIAIKTKIHQNFMTIFWQTSALVRYQQWVETHLAHLMKDLMDILKGKVLRNKSELTIPLNTHPLWTNFW